MAGRESTRCDRRRNKGGTISCAEHVKTCSTSTRLTGVGTDTLRKLQVAELKRLLVRDSETIVVTASGEIVARYPGVMDHIATHPDGRTWAGANSNYLALIHLEGTDHS